MVCDWYTIPNGDFDTTRGSITLHLRICPIDFSDFGHEWKHCEWDGSDAVVRFWINDPLPRNPWPNNGNLTFSWLLPGSYEITTNLGVPGKVYCSTLATLGNPYLEQEMDPGELLDLEVNGGDDLLCDWYVYPDTEYWREA